MPPQPVVLATKEVAVRNQAKGDADVVYVAGTGSGKSIAFIYPAYVSPGGTTIIVTPFIALRDQIASQFNQAGIAGPS
ncbi:RecQ helicase [Colletotrichum asianum]